MRLGTTNTAHFVAATIGIVAFAVAGRAFAQPAEAPAVPAEPAEVVAALHEGIVAAAADPDRTVEQRYAELEPLVERTHDLPYIAELSIRRHWADLTDEQRQRFLAAFSRLSVMTYASRFATVTAETFEVLGSEDAGSGRVQVHAAIHRAEDPDVSLDYQLHEVDGAWKIINILADGVSDLALKRAEYARVLGSGTIDDLIAELESQIDDLR
jgi:phospholipid transport system substrate-binding protein